VRTQARESSVTGSVEEGGLVREIATVEDAERSPGR
jgi:hypothetical protein